jgi:hypothetical protein
MLLLSLLALAADTVPDRGVLLVSASTLINAGSADTLELENIGGSTLELSVDRASFGAGTTTVVVAPRAKAKVLLRYDGTCGPSEWGPCVTGSVHLSAPGGSLAVLVQVLPPRTGMLGVLPARLYWDPSGPPPTGGVLGGFGSRAGRTTLPDLPVGAPTIAKGSHGDVRTSLSYPRGAAATLGPLESALSAAAATCDTRIAASTLDVSGHVNWAADGRITGVRVNRALGVSERCVVVALLAASVGAGPGEAGFRASPAAE